jgi:hypothetical protein
MGGDDEVPVVGPGKALGLARAAMVRQQMVVRVGMTSGPVGNHADDAGPAVARAADPTTGRARAAPRPRPFGGLSPLSASSLIRVATA